MTIDHFLSEKNIILTFTEEFVGWVSAAEGFVFLSGLTAGLVYTYKLNQKGYTYIANASKSRAWLIYKYHLVLLTLTIAILFAHPVIGQFWVSRFEFILQHLLLAFTLGGLFLYQPIYLDILPMYAVLMLLVPVILKYFQKGYIWQIIVFSGFLYFIGTADLKFNRLSGLAISQYIDLGNFDIFCWQLIFISGLLAGHLLYHGRIEGAFQHYKFFYSTVIITTILFFTKLWYTEFYDPTQVSGLGEYARLSKYSFVDKENLRPVRLLNFFSVVYMVAFIAVKNKHWFTSKPICRLGRYSLEVFSLHIILIILFKPVQVYTDELYPVRINDDLNFYPVTTLFLLFIILPALFIVPVLKERRSKLIKAKATA